MGGRALRRARQTCQRVDRVTARCDRGISPPAAIAAKAITASIPIVFTSSGDPVALGLVPSLNKPGGNITGFNLMLFAMGSKRLDLLAKLVPEKRSVGLLVNGKNPSSKAAVAETQAAASLLGKDLLVERADTESAIDASFENFVRNGVEAISVEADPYLLARRNQIVSRAARYSLPAIYPHREYVEAGGLVSYGVDLNDGYRQVGRYTARILDGAVPAELPVLQASKFELVINKGTANTLNVTIPPDVLSLTDELIE